MSTETTETDQKSSDARRTPMSGVDLAALSRSVLRVARTFVRVLTLVFAGILAVHVVLTVARANPDNAITVFFRDWAAGLTLGVGDLFVPQNPDLRIVLNLGLAAVLWIVIGAVVAKVLGALDPGPSRQ